jgi:hypothetical protein
MTFGRKPSIQPAREEISCGRFFVFMTTRFNEETEKTVVVGKTDCRRTLECQQKYQGRSHDPGQSRGRSSTEGILKNPGKRDP